MKAFPAIFLFLLGVGTCSAQEFLTIKGRILDGDSEAPLPFCSVFVRGESVGTVANVTGAFTLNIPERFMNDTLVISHVGYKNHYALIRSISEKVQVRLFPAPINLEEITVETKKLSAQEIFRKALEKIQADEGYPREDFRMDGFFREVHQSNEERTGVLECAISIFDHDVTKKFGDIAINQFRKVYDRKQNTDQFIGTKEGHNHLLLLLNGGINLIPLAKKYKASIWKLPLELKELTYFNDRLVYVLANEKYGRVLKLYVDVEDFTVFKNELIMAVKEQDHENYAWRKVNSKGEECGAMLDHQSYEYRRINGKLFPYYAFRRMDFRCFDLTTDSVSSTAYLSKELLINDVVYHPSITAKDKLRKKQGLINRKEPYDSTFWRFYNDIQSVDQNNQLVQDFSNAKDMGFDGVSNTPSAPDTQQLLKIGDHAARAFTRADTLFGTLTPDLACYDVHHYALDLNIDPERAYISGEVSMHFKVVAPIRSIRLDLLEFMDIHEIRSSGQSLRFERDLDAVYVHFDEALTSGEYRTLSVQYGGHPLEPTFGEVWTGGFMWRRDTEGRPFAQTLCQGYGAKGWWPVKNHLSDEPDSVHLTVTVPSGLGVVSNGVQIGRTENPDHTHTYQWKVNYPINTYNIAVHLGAYAHERSTYSSNQYDMTLDYYFLVEDSVLARERLAMVPRMLEVYEKYFGPYPFPLDGFKIVQSPYPMEHQSCVAAGPYLDDILILHETAHEWWGNHVSITDNADIWIHEAFATYAESLYIEETLGYDMGQKYLNSRKSEIHNDHPIVGVRNVNHFHYRIEDKYFKGALMLNTLRQMVNDDVLWFRTLKGIQSEFSHGFIDTEKLTQYLGEQLDLDLQLFFEQYLRTIMIPVLEVRPESDGQVAYRWGQVVDGFRMPVEFGGNRLNPTGMWQTTSMEDYQNIRVLQEQYLIRVVEVASD